MKGKYLSWSCERTSSGVAGRRRIPSVDSSSWLGGSWVTVAGPNSGRQTFSRPTWLLALLKRATASFSVWWSARADPPPMARAPSATMPTSTRFMARKQYRMTQQKSSIELTRRAIDAAVTTARRLGLRAEQPLLLHDASNALVHLRPAPVVARVATTTAMSRQGGAEHLAREIAIASHLARAGAPVIPPSGDVDPGPHSEDGLALSLWELAERLPGPPSPAAAGRALRECHEALAEADLDLPPLESLH